MKHHHEYARAIDAAFHAFDRLREPSWHVELAGELIAALGLGGFAFEECLSEGASAALAPAPTPSDAAQLRAKHRAALDQNTRHAMVLGLSVTAARKLASAYPSPSAHDRAAEIEKLARRAVERMHAEPTSVIGSRAAVRRALEAHAAMVPELYAWALDLHTQDLKLPRDPMPRLVQAAQEPSPC